MKQTKSQRKNLFSEVIIKEAKKHGIRCQYLDEKGLYYSLTKGKKSYRFFQALSDATGSIAYMTDINKTIGNRFLKMAGFPVPKQKLCSTFGEAQEFLQANKPIVVKPKSLTGGKGVTVNVRTVNELKKAYSKVRKLVGKVLVEKMAPGYDVRLLVIDYKIVYGLKRTPAYVIGDGTSTISELIDRRNAIKHRFKYNVPKDLDTKSILKGQGYKLTSIPNKGKKVDLRLKASIHAGGEGQDITDDLPPKIVKTAIQVAQHLKLPLVGMDVITPDIKKNIGKIIEVNSNPDLPMHIYPHKGKPRDPAKDIIRMLFKN